MVNLTYVGNPISNSGFIGKGGRTMSRPSVRFRFSSMRTENSVRSPRPIHPLLPAWYEKEHFYSNRLLNRFIQFIGYKCNSTSDELFSKINHLEGERKKGDLEDVDKDNNDEIYANKSVKVKEWKFRKFEEEGVNEEGRIPYDLRPSVMYA
ncbi:hypothetical protein INT47_000401 [Mucor saturninus]|uniref:Uncharacterized protein n=1 Tax=Mucor saturninus TaxID=64648 RepID=A0A8H7UWE5_9FUNG|nr:hypothetical protein INT47_000401 [Mucor saturninus]